MRADRFVFFDLDGVLIDSAPAIERALNSTLARHGYSPLSSDAVRPYIGPPIYAAFQSILATLGEEPERAAACVATFRSIYAESGPRETPLMPGVGELLDRLAERFPLAVATSKAQYLAETILTALDVIDRFVCVVGPAPDALDETKTSTLGRAIARVDAPPHRLMIGDRKYDIAAGRVHHCRTIGVTWGSGSRQELRDAGADVIVDDTRSLFETIAA